MKLDLDRFNELLSKPIEELHVDNGVGTLSEKYLHALLKNYYEANKSFHEVKIERFTADICRGNEIIEIQTRQLNRLREKLEAYMLLGYNVRVVYPIPRQRWLVWVDNETGETTKRRKSPKIGSFFSSFFELYKIKYFLDWDKLTIELLLFDAEEYRNLDGYGKHRKYRSTRLEMMPLAFVDSLTLESPKDYMAFIPDNLPSIFKSSDYAKAMNTDLSYANTALNILNYLGVTQKCGRDGRAYLYEVNHEMKTNPLKTGDTLEN